MAAAGRLRHLPSDVVGAVLAADRAAMPVSGCGECGRAATARFLGAGDLARVRGGLLARLVLGLGATATDAAFFATGFFAFAAVAFFATGFVVFAAVAFLGTGLTAVAFLATGLAAAAFLATGLTAVAFLATGLAAAGFVAIDVVAFAAVVFLATGFVAVIFLATGFVVVVFLATCPVAFAAAFFTARFFAVAFFAIGFATTLLFAAAFAGFAAEACFDVDRVGVAFVGFLAVVGFVARCGDEARLVTFVDARRDVAGLDGLRGGATWFLPGLP
jgi:hypothetical protein